jgi:hypothetical protein
MVPTVVIIPPKTAGRIPARGSSAKENRKRNTPGVIIKKGHA